MAKRDKKSGGKKSGGKKTGARLRRESYKGHEIVYPVDQRRKKIFIDGRPVTWGEAGGTYYLDVYAYDRGSTLEETIKRYIDYLAKSVRPARKEGK